MLIAASFPALAAIGRMENASLLSACLIYQIFRLCSLVTP